MGTAGRSTRLAAVVRTVTAPISLTLPHDWHSPHRPTHLTAVQPHSEQRKPLDLVDVLAAMDDNLRRDPDIGRERSRAPGGGQCPSTTFLRPSSMPCQFCENCSACSGLSQPSWVSLTSVPPPAGESS